MNATCTLGRIIQYEPIKILSNDGFDDGVTIDIVDEYGESSGTFGETYRVLVVGETRMMVEDVNETPAGYVAGTYSLVNSPDSKFAVQPTEDERNQIEQLADDVELLMNYVIEFGDSLLKVSNMTKETLFDDVVRKRKLQGIIRQKYIENSPSKKQRCSNGQNLSVRLILYTRA